MWPVINFKYNNCDIYIGRPSRWGNPFHVGINGSREDVILMYENWLQSRTDLLSEICELSGKILGCWCSPSPCHGDVLVRIANGWQLIVPLILENEK